MKITIATRKSALALWQAEHVASILRLLDSVDAVELLPLSTRGDEILDRSLQKTGGKGLFIKELEVAMRQGRADIAVHSMKDVPADMPEDFCLAAVLERSNPADALIARDKRRLDQLPNAAVVGSSSLRRQAQLKILRPDLEIRPLRGNVNTRLARLERGDYDAIVLAATGLERLQLDHHICQQFTIEEMVPATAQGVLGIECLAEREDLSRLLADVSDPTTLQTTSAERAVARALEASCQSPVAAFATSDGETIEATGLVALPDGSRFIRRTVTGTAKEPGLAGGRLAEALLTEGAADLLVEAENMNG